MSGRNELPPVWVDIQETIEEKLQKAEEKFTELKQLRGLRFKPKFDDNEDRKLDFQIDALVTQLTTTIRDCERDLRDMMKEEDGVATDTQIKNNIKQTYLLRLQEVTRKLRALEKEHLKKMTDLYGQEGEAMFADNKQDQLVIAEVGNITEGRQTQIKKVVTQINELAVIFKELSILVVEQGTVLDRIDYNVQMAKENVQKANVEIEKTLERETSFRAKGCMSCLVTGIAITLGLLVFKHLL
ncbi:hypothetical protein FGO68_gene12507 [Halteria grandinella]|uniref:t-SNARE coiled-coil homology domain-containing protein n=1 Tax=Halteria grandinella TaxID=5974 RepID=A0A8J8NP32_HALGN|nr:hypothetical protein FGO68_gene12507 [Halteria grandinella]